MTNITTETGAGQWGAALSYAAKVFGLESAVYQVKISYEQKPYRINTFHKYALANWPFVGALNFIMIFLAIFSKEKVEDEMTTAIRLDTLLYLVFFIFGIHVLLYLPVGRVRDLIINIRDFFIEDFGVLALTYAALYKIMIWINMWRMRNEE